MSAVDVPSLAPTLVRLALRADGSHAPELGYALRELVGGLSPHEARQLAHYQAWLTATVLGCVSGEAREAILAAYEQGVTA